MSESGGSTRGSRVEMNASVGVRSESGMYFGAVRWMEDQRMLVEISAELVQGEQVDAKVTLTAAGSSALVKAVVGRSQATAKGEVPRYILHILEVNANDQEFLTVWLQNLREGGTLSTFDTVISTADVRSDAQSPDEVRYALRRMTTAPGGAPHSAPTDPWGGRSDVSPATGGRTAVRDALRKAIARTRPPGAEESLPPAPKAVAPGPVRPAPPPTQPAFLRSDAQSWPGSPPPPRAPSPTLSPPSTPGAGFAFVSPPSSPPSAPPAAERTPGRVVAIGGGAPRAPLPQAQPGRVVALGRSAEPPGRVVASSNDSPDVTFAVSATRSATWMEVKWHNAAAFARDISMQLAHYVLVLRTGPEPFPEQEPIRCMLRFEDVQLEIPASVLAIGPESATYRVNIDALQMERLKVWEREYLKRSR